MQTGITASPPPPRSTDADEVRKALSVRILIVALIAQFALAGGVIYFAVNGFPMIGAGPHRLAVPDGSTTGPTASTAATAAVPRARVDRFDGPRAYRLTAAQVAVGQRPAGSPQLARLAERLRAMLPAGHFEALPGSTPSKPLRNIVGTLPGRKPAIVVGAHYDTLVKPAGFVGANNGAAGTAVVIGLARALRKVHRAPGAPEIRFVLFDGEEPDAGLPEDQPDFYKVGLRGSRAYVAAHPGQTRAMVLLDYVGGRGLRLPREATSDPALWARIRAAARAVGVAPVFPDRTDIAIQDDHTPFLRAGVPAVDLIDWSYPGHTLQDGMPLISTRSLDAVGETLVAYLRGRP